MSDAPWGLHLNNRKTAQAALCRCHHTILLVGLRNGPEGGRPTGPRGRKRTQTEEDLLPRPREGSGFISDPGRRIAAHWSQARSVRVGESSYSTAREGPMTVRF